MFIILLSQQNIKQVQHNLLLLPAVQSRCDGGVNTDRPRRYRDATVVSSYITERWGRAAGGFFPLKY